MNDAILILCSRPESRRLPEKVFRKAAGKSLLELIDHRASMIQPLDSMRVLAIPTGLNNNALDRYSKQWTGAVAEGDPESPLHRMAEVLSYSAAEWVIRVTHDDPLIDPRTAKELLDACRNTPNCGYGYSPGIIDGAGIEVIHRDNLLHAAKNSGPTEYVSYHVRGKGTPRPKIVQVRPRPEIRRDYRLTIDYPEDMNLLKIVLREVGPDASADAVCDFLDRNAHLALINKMPVATIYTCVHNGSKYIEDTLRSIINEVIQFDDVEFILVDDASTDDTLVKATRVLFGIKHKLIINEENIGLASSCNIALSESRGRFIMRVDADDMLMPGMLNRLYGKINNKRAAVVYPAYLELTESGSGTVIDPSVNHHAGCALFDKTMLNEVRFTDGLRNWDSLDVYNRIKARYPVAYHNEPLWFYRRHGSNMSIPSPEREAEKRRIAK